MDDAFKVLRAFGCEQFGHMVDHEHGDVIVQFKFRGTPVSVKASLQGYAAAWLKENPYTNRRKCSRQDHELEALRIAQRAVYSVLRDWIKGQVTAIQTGVISFEGAFLGQILLPSGKTILEHAKGANLLPAPK